MRREKLISRVETNKQIISFYGSSNGMRVVIEMVDSDAMHALCEGLRIGASVSGGPMSEVHAATRANKKFISEYKKIERERLARARRAKAAAEKAERQKLRKAARRASRNWSP